MNGKQPENFSAGRKSVVFALLLPILLTFFMLQSMTVLGQDRFPAGGTPQVGVSKVVNNDEVAPGSTVRYTIVISNSGDGPANDLVMTDTLPIEFDIVTSSLVSDTFQGYTNLLTVTNDIVTWEGALGPNGGEVEISFQATLTDTAVFDTVITNTAEITGTGTALTATAALTVVDEYFTFLPIVFKPLEVPAMESAAVPTSGDSFATYDILVTWEDLNDPTLTYELQESTDPSFTNPTVYDAGNATSFAVHHSSLLTYRFYYRVRAVRTSQSLYSDWSNTVVGYGVYRDNFNSSTSGWKMRREDTDDTNNSVSYQDSRLRVKIGGRWDSMIASPLVPTPPTWSNYRINTSVELGEGIDYLHSYGIVFGGDWNGSSSCPNSNFSSCFNRYYRLNVVWQGHDKPFRVHLKRIDSHNTSNNTDTGVTLMPWRDLGVGNPNGFNNWTIDVHDNGKIELYVNGNKFHTVTDTNYVAGGRYFGTFASSQEYLGTAAFYEYWEVEPIP